MCYAVVALALSPQAVEAERCQATYLALKQAAGQARELYRALRHDVPEPARLLVRAHYDRLAQQADAAKATYQQAVAAAYPPTLAPATDYVDEGEALYRHEQHLAHERAAA